MVVIPTFFSYVISKFKLKTQYSVQIMFYKEESKIGRVVN